MSSFTDIELAYLGDRRLGRVATVGKDGTPHVAPVGWSYNAEADTIDMIRIHPDRVVSWGLDERAP
jgi:pyridoxamine 5'-phosphate oxidase family protein